MKKWTDKEILAWHKKTFPNATLASQVEKLDEEMEELANSKGSSSVLEETADVIICCRVLRDRFKCQFANYIANCMFNQLGDDSLRSLVVILMCRKMDENAARKWVEIKPGYYRHEND